MYLPNTVFPFNYTEQNPVQVPAVDYHYQATISNAAFFIKIFKKYTKTFGAKFFQAIRRKQFFFSPFTG
jgi:hypothetical protein